MSEHDPSYQRPRKKNLHIADYVSGILAGDRIILSRAITLIESTRHDHREMAKDIIEQCLPHANRSVRIGITGSPGVGKSTFIEAFGAYAIEKGHRLAVLAIDPSSQLSKGSILGDKTRMPQLSNNDRAYIRPSPAGDSLGGVARQTREAIILCEAAGFDTIVVETVGVGQSEVAVHSMVDFFLLLLLPGAGDELQGIKRGIVEMADLIAVNKADGEREALARQARQAYRNALHLFPPKESGWTPQAITCSALSRAGIPEVWQLIIDYLDLTRNNQYFEEHRRRQSRYWLYETIQAALQERFFQHPAVRALLPAIEQAVAEGKMSPFKGGEELMGVWG